MSRKMERGKQQVMFNYLPGRTFDFAKTDVIALVESVRGAPAGELNPEVVLRRVRTIAAAWRPDNRPSLRDDVLADSSRFVLLEPKEVQSTLFPKVFWCTNSACGRVLNFTGSDRLPDRRCPSCNQRSLIQLRWVRVHRCGLLEPLTPPRCSTCSTDRSMALDLRGSERLGNFRWRCLNCRTASNVYGGPCRVCNWQGDDAERRVDIEVHRSKRTHYPHTTVLLNVPQRRLDNLLRTPGWELLVAAKYLGLAETAQTALTELGSSERSEENDTGGLSGADLDSLLAGGATGASSPEQVLERLKALRLERSAQREAASAGAIGARVTAVSGIPDQVWRDAGYELLEVLMPMELGRPVSIDASPGGSEPQAQLGRLGVQRLTLVADYPIITAAFGFSRSDYRPNRCRLNAFGQMREHGGRYPIFVDEVQADALTAQLDPERVHRWLVANGVNPILPTGEVAALARRGHFVALFRGASLYQTLQAEAAEVRMTFGLLHSLAHLSVRQAGLLCGLDATSLSEYLLPSTLTFGIYCNHRFGATIGALTALFEQSLPEWLGRIERADQCVYDPVCRDVGGSCHSCLHLAETSCRYFNLNLSRSFLFGGFDTVLGQVRVGYFDRTLD